MYRNDVFERITYIMKSTDQEDAIRPCFAKLAEAMGCDYRTVKAAYEKMKNGEDNETSRPPKPSKLDPYKSTVDAWLMEDKKLHRKQRHSARRVFDLLKSKHPDFDCSYRLVAIYIAAKKKELILKDTLKDGYLPLLHYPGGAQVDFGETQYKEDSQLNTGKYLTLTCPHSNAGYIQLFPGENIECLLEGLQAIFEHIGGVPTEIWFDNTATIVTSIMRGGDRKLTDRFLRFQEHYGFKAKFMNPRSGWEKGSVENKVGYYLSGPINTDSSSFTRESISTPPHLLSVRKRYVSD